MSKVNLDTAARLDIVCRKGDSFSLTVEFDTDMPNPAEGDIDYLLEVRKTDVSSSITEDTFKFERDATNKKITITNSAANMAAIDSGIYVYDLQVKDSSGVVYTVKTYLFGTFEIVEDISVTT